MSFFRCVNQWLDDINWVSVAGVGSVIAFLLGCILGLVIQFYMHQNLGINPVSVVVDWIGILGAYGLMMIMFGVSMTCLWLAIFLMGEILRIIYQKLYKKYSQF